MDPYQQQTDQLNNQYPTNKSTSDPPDRQQQPQHVSGYTVITPNELKRNNLRTTAQRGIEELRRAKEEQRSIPVHINPERLGGSGSLEEAREKQFRDQRCSKLQKKLKREEEKKRAKELEEREQQRKKDIQREKAERQEQKKQQQETRRREQFLLDHQRVNDSFLQQYETKASSSRSAPLPSPNTRDVPNAKTLEEIQQEHKRKNAEFLDNLEMRNLNLTCASSSSSSPSPDREPSSRPQTSPEPRFSGLAAGEDEPATASEQDFDWSLMKLMTNFPHCDKDVLEDILSQCSGDYQQAYGLLSL